MELGNKHIGVIKWFHDQQRDAYYGFIQHSKLGDIYFNSRGIAVGQSMQKFIENEVVVFEKKSSRMENSLEAYNVKLVENEENIIFLFSEFLSLFAEKGIYSDYNLVQKRVFNSIQKLNINIDEIINSKLKRLFSDLIENTSFTFDKAKTMISLAKSLFPSDYLYFTTLIFSKLDRELLFQFWLEGTNEYIDIEYAIFKILNNPSEKTVAQIFKRCKETEKNDLILKTLSSLGYINDLNKYKKIIFFLRYAKQYLIENYEEIIASTVKNCSSNYRLELWLDLYSNYFNFDEFVVFVNDLNVEKQVKFFKRTIKLIHEGLIVLNAVDLVRIQGDNIDYSLSIVIQAINDLAKARVTEKKTIFEIIAKQVKNPNELLQIKDFFDKCNGRYRAIVNQNDNSDNEDSTKFQLKLADKKPRFAVICDGRKVEQLCKKTGLEYWWCENDKCYSLSRKLHNKEQWEQYSLWDCLYILKIKFDETHYEILLNVINKVNRFLEHLKCRGCNEILRPIGKTLYSFWGVSDFCCTNDNCKAKEKSIYISHCLNGKCNEIIDSRDNIKCNPEGGHPDCGWYVCNYCNACCNSPQLQKRQWVYENILDRPYPCHLVGHKDLGQLCCNKCGEVMSNNNQLTNEFPKVLNWFIENKDTNPYILKSGQREYGKWWFIFVKKKLSVDEYRKKISKLISIGFNIPNYQKEDNFSQLVVEPSIVPNIDSAKVFTCSNCNHVIDLRSNKDKYDTIYHIHKKVFAK